MNIGIVTVWDERGAGYVSMHYRNYLSTFFDIYIYNRGYSKNKFQNDERVYKSKKVSSFKPMSIHKKEFKKWIDKYKIETVLFNEQQSWDPIIWCKEWGIKTIAYIDYYTEETIELHNAYDLLICNTKRHYEAFEKHKNVKYFPWGTDLNLFKPKNIDNKTPTFLHSCGFSPSRKGTDSVLRAFENIELDFKLIIHSQIDLIKEYPELTYIINKLEKSEKLEIITKTVPAPGLYYLADYYVYPTRLEGIGLTISESICSGLVPIIPDCPPMIEFLPEQYKYKIKVNREVSRFDGYYWPQCIISVNHLEELINLAIKEFPNQNLKSSLKEWAIQKLNFRKNFKGLEFLIENLKFYNLDPKTKKLINSFEAKRPINHKKLNNLMNLFILPLYAIIKRILNS